MTIRRILIRRDTAAAWTSSNPTLASGELGGETDTGKLKLGNGSTAWNSLAYQAGVTSVNGSTGAVTGLAPTASPTFTGTVVLPATTSIGTITNTELSYVDGVTSAIQTQIDTKAPLASPTFTGTVSGVTATMVGLGSVNNTADTAKPVSTAQQTALDLKANIASPTFTGTVAGISSTMVSALPLALTLNAQTGTTYTLVLADNAKFVTCSNASAVVVTVPPNSSVAFPTGTQVNIMMLGAGSTSIAAGAGVTIRSDGAKLTFNAQYAVATLLKIDTDTWVAVGNLKA